MNSLPDSQRGQAPINLLLSSRIIVDGYLEDSELPLQQLMKTKVNLLCTQAFVGGSEGRLKNLTFRFSHSPYATAMQDKFHLNCQGNLDKNLDKNTSGVCYCAVHLSLQQLI